MKFENLLELIKAVSDSSLTEFKYEENDISVKLAKNSGVVQVVEAPQTVVSAPVAEPAEAVETTVGKVITSPLVGTFYAAPGEDMDAFVKVGDRVEKGQVLAIVEAMKLMNEIESDIDGVIEEILVENAQMVEYGQPLFRLQ
ncbi:acetyl-CoA carboxylase biotin carboxyl carrier protein [Aequitasia blattaphilus]|uniref:Biotin carboxyl carrier protein of acetyl-CoA carboxylase n=1 Tax=Aequitasia blattaphilus TaxID=2949332 RepID=A0ABT1E7T1_9FIRM|nr:acetyl-CoA carboxylase biotin carboxyl carrier protein [Aequitasia blattaphilus]MCP1101885.1 acetyl-CoA carboxylase biotin carboxyl carrier protein [Aequitasia blattaphilus]MCR8614525.1 acetyl-CoA carboxylase biotin carboxyl carrier protein [Aequitasia blattaphilus]